MKRPIESDYTSLVAYTRAFEEYCDALAQPAQEPVGKFAKFTDGIWREVTDGSAGVPLYTIPPAQEFMCSTGLCHFTFTQTNVGIGKRGMEAYKENT
jgi:hypothetical protein